MKKLTLMLLLMSILLGGAYAQKYGNNLSVSEAIVAITFPYAGIGQFVNHNWIDGGLFLVFDAGFITMIVLPYKLDYFGKSSVARKDGSYDATLAIGYLGMIISIFTQLGLLVTHRKSLASYNYIAFNEDRQKLKQTYLASRMKPLNEFAQSFSVAGTNKGVGVFLTKTL